MALIGALGECMSIDCRPPVPPEIDLRSYSWMKLDLCRLHSSDFIHLATNEEFGAAVKLWTEAMRQVPASSLPNDDRILASLVGYRGTHRRWQKIKPMALHGFSLCSDGRLYHPVLAEMALDAWKPQQASVTTDPRAKDRERLRRWRAEQRAKQAEQVSEAKPAPASTPTEMGETFPETVETFHINRRETERTDKKQNMIVSEMFPETPSSVSSGTPTPTRESTLCEQLRALGVRAAPHMVVVQEMCAKHSDQQILVAAETALEKKGSGIHVNYIAAMLKNGATDWKTNKKRSTVGPPNRQMIPPVPPGGSHYVKL